MPISVESEISNVTPFKSLEALGYINPENWLDRKIPKESGRLTPLEYGYYKRLVDGGKIPDQPEDLTDATRFLGICENLVNIGEKWRVSEGVRWLGETGVRSASFLADGSLTYTRDIGKNTQFGVNLTPVELRGIALPQETGNLPIFDLLLYWSVGNEPDRMKHIQVTSRGAFEFSVGITDGRMYKQPIEQRQARILNMILREIDDLVRNPGPFSF